MTVGPERPTGQRGRPLRAVTAGPVASHARPDMTHDQYMAVRQLVREYGDPSRVTKVRDLIQVIWFEQGRQLFVNLDGTRFFVEVIHSW